MMEEGGTYDGTPGTVNEEYGEEEPYVDMVELLELN
jgi:hypothetical protein